MVDDIRQNLTKGFFFFEASNFLFKFGSKFYFKNWFQQEEKNLPRVPPLRQANTQLEFFCWFLPRWLHWLHAGRRRRPAVPDWMGVSEGGGVGEAVLQVVAKPPEDDFVRAKAQPDI